jgi:6-phosphogluconolactonase
MRVEIARDAPGLAGAAADMIATWLNDTDGAATFAIAGGGTPAETYRQLRSRRVPWERVTAWVGDERWVPPDHPDNNGRMAREALIDHVPASFVPVPYAGETPESAAHEYEARLREILAVRDGRPAPDVVLLGIGDDGHTLSLFPGTAALEESERLYVANWVPKLDTWRVTATYPLVHAARHVLFLVAGAGKAETVARILEDPDADDPARRIMEGDADVVWLLDEAAAGRLTSEPE